MSLFKPAEIRAILILSILALIGSAMTLLNRQGKLENLDLLMFLNNDRYKYSRRVDSADRELNKTEINSEAERYTPAVKDSSGIGIININRAGYFDLQSLPGIGPVLAERIIAYRDSAGDFSSLDELSNVKGIGEKKLAAFKSRITIK